MVTDAGYGSEENYAFLEEHGLGNFVKYNTFHQEQIQHRKPEILERERFRSGHFPYDAERDESICPAEKRLTYRATHRLKTENGYRTERRMYAWGECGASA